MHMPIFALILLSNILRWIGKRETELRTLPVIKVSSKEC
ncbi:hypothetical protein LEP1GSC047_3767 [Leptospira inadai serovar Lyme str. 10]|uniref:Uncharacterized protein n=1 Tax=Leptospira inadai serovar Lyme str. 10 TaxID=1049790 RepID=V6HXY4_9LEPT|nr:hypothetical protein LEP1GSC047_3767 [Leptospira inadai serovar Lyme str. 10]